jgi:hypothetical protein
VTFVDGGCVGVGGSIDNYYASTAIAPSGPGSCTVQTTQAGSLTTTPSRTCTPESQCNSATCAGTVPDGWLACIITDGDKPCPAAPFNQKHAIVKSVTFACAPTCGPCNVTGTCDTPQIHMFSGGSCTSPLVTLPSDTTCAPTQHGNTNVATASYTATPNFKCNASGTSAVQVQPTTLKTVCCR